MAVAIADPSGHIDMLSAGHGPMFLFRAATRAVEQFSGAGLPLGVVDGELYTPVDRLRLDSGDALVLLTDGFMERQGADGGMFGIERLTALIAANAARTAAELIEAIDKAVTDFAGRVPQGDDMTAVVLRRL